MTWDTIRKRMRRRREALGWTQEEAAHRCGVGHNSIGGWETGKINPTVPSFLKWCEGLEIDPARVLASRARPDAV